VEDTDTSFEELEKVFGLEVRNIVAEVSDDKSLPKAERKRLQVIPTARPVKKQKLLSFYKK
jgi:guanosine-3',5'-bis(diphosphate) 3'-pyrophosphohydrolase